MPTDISIGLLALYVAIGALALLVVGLNPKWLPALLVFVMPTNNFSLEGPVSFSLSKIVLLVFVITLPAQIAASARETRRIRIPLSLLVFFLIVIIATLGSLPSLANISGEGFDTLRGPVFRPMVQVISLGLRASAFVAIQVWVSDDASWARVCKTTLFVSTFVAAYGIYQFFGYYSGLPIVSIHRPQADLSGGYAFMSIGSRSIFRVGSFVGEPKEAALFLLPSIILIIFARATAIPRLQSWLTSIPILVLHVITFILTFATSSLFGLFVSLPILSLLLFRIPGRLRLDRLLIAFLVVSLAVGAVVAFGGGLGTANQILMSRTTERVQKTDVPEPAALDFLNDHPVTLLTGIGWGNTSFYLRPYFDPAYYRPLNVSLESGYFQILLEGGLLALLVFLWFLGGPLLLARQIAMREQDNEYRGMVTTTLAVCVIVGATNAFFYGAELQIWVFWGLLVSLCRTKTGSGVRSVSWSQHT